MFTDCWSWYSHSCNYTSYWWNGRRSAVELLLLDLHAIHFCMNLLSTFYIFLNFALHNIVSKFRARSPDNRPYSMSWFCWKCIYTLLSLCQCGLGRYFTSYYSQVGGYRGKAIVWLGIKSYSLTGDQITIEWPPVSTFCPHFTQYNRCQLTYWYHTHAAWCSATMLAHGPGII